VRQLAAVGKQFRNDVVTAVTTGTFGTQAAKATRANASIAEIVHRIVAAAYGVFAHGLDLWLMTAGAPMGLSAIVAGVDDGTGAASWCHPHHPHADDDEDVAHTGVTPGPHRRGDRRLAGGARQTGEAAVTNSSSGDGTAVASRSPWLGTLGAWVQRWCRPANTLPAPHCTCSMRRHRAPQRRAMRTRRVRVGP